jgi:hypothetical protein
MLDRSAIADMDSRVGQGILVGASDAYSYPSVEIIIVVDSAVKSERSGTLRAGATGLP